MGSFPYVLHDDCQEAKENQNLEQTIESLNMSLSLPKSLKGPVETRYWKKAVLTNFSFSALLEYPDFMVDSECTCTPAQENCKCTPKPS